MLKKVTAFYFILLANFVLLAHAVIPHHYHKQQVCVEKTHCKDDINTHLHNSPEHNHEHEGNNNSSTCILQAVFLPSSQSRQETACAVSTRHQSKDYSFSLIYSSVEVQISETRFQGCIPDIVFSYSSYLTTSLGLRAPPTV